VGFEGRNYQLIAPYVSALPSNELKVNINTAPALVLASIDLSWMYLLFKIYKSKDRPIWNIFPNVNELWEVDPFKQVDEAQRAAVNDFLGVQSNYLKPE
jgi:general secretion pathway protein K